MAYSFIGWVYESTLCSITEHKLVNRGFLNGPVCPIYGVGALIILFLLGDMANQEILPLFLSSAVLTCTLEYITSWLLEKCFHTRWWDYSKYRFQLNGRICLLGAVAFGALSVLLLKIVHPWISGLIANIPIAWRYIVGGVLFLLFICDIWLTVKSILNFNQRLAEIQAIINQEAAHFRETLGEKREQFQILWEEQKDQFLQKFETNSDAANRLRELINQHKLIEKRLLKAFPKMESVKYRDALSQLRQKLQKYKK